MTDSYKEFVYGAEGSGLFFKIIVTEDASGNLTASVQMLEGTMDLNALWFSDGDSRANESGSTTLSKSDSALNMNGATYDVGGDGTQDRLAWDGVQKLSSAGLGPDGTAKSTFLEAGETLSINLNFTCSLDDLDYIGVRATSVNGGGSIKLIDEGEMIDPPPPQDDFPAWGQDISNIVLVFRQTEGDVKPNIPGPTPDGDGYYTVKIDEWMDQAPTGGDDLDDYIGQIIDWLILNDVNIDPDYDLLGVVIKGGTDAQGGGADYFSYGDYNTNGTDPDPLPDSIGFVVDDQTGATPANAVDVSYDYADVFLL